MVDIEIFDVEHGACSLVTADNGRRILVDCGHNSSTGWRPSWSLPARGIRHVDRLIVSNYDRDHVSDLPSLLAAVEVPVLSRNPSVWPDLLRAMKAENGMDPGISTLAYMAGNHYTQDLPAPQDFGAIQVSHYWNTYPVFTDENNLSLVTIIHYHDLGIIFPGDVEKAGWLQLLQRPDFRAALAGVNIFVASHHGRENGYCPDVFNWCNPEVVIFSDGAVVHDTQKTAALYRQHTRGIRFFDSTTRHVLTTRKNGLIRLTQTGPGGGLIWISKG